MNKIDQVKAKIIEAKKDIDSLPRALGCDITTSPILDEALSLLDEIDRSETFDPLDLGATTRYFDFSDKSTLFQDLDGKVPVESIGQPVKSAIAKAVSGACKRSEK